MLSLASKPWDYDGIMTRSYWKKVAKTAINQWFFLSMGRPMWYAYLSLLGGVDGVSVFAMEKLLLAGMKTLPTVLTPVPIAALLASHSNLSIHITGPMACTHPCFKSYGATAVHLSSDGETLMPSHPSEPILAIAAKRYMAGNPEFLAIALKYMKQ